MILLLPSLPSKGASLSPLSKRIMQREHKLTTNFLIYITPLYISPINQTRLTYISLPLSSLFINLAPKMCLSSSEPFSDTPTRLVLYLKTQSHVRIPRLSRRRRMWREEKKMEMINLKLYVENQNIIRENEKLRKKALLLHQENKALFSLLQTKKLSSVP
ncbi:LOW QUALITY PROTEIN: protein LITTLE ZIPPER 1 [Arabidopsis lyrata subsp. lyrata]|nr:LOW QUALITY PROTEIN: protein LITTLE ZIPPER 1 [Arabidopsis lyrata subsp. lyrata]|eukprot:XP_002882013.2 LOW QUALITY PROTEIN: protein LITTLE ZIPPER 1 [Arabidopsis lyrata subsp. lyrata]